METPVVRHVCAVREGVHLSRTAQGHIPALSVLNASGIFMTNLLISSSLQLTEILALPFPS